MRLHGTGNTIWLKVCSHITYFSPFNGPFLPNAYEVWGKVMFSQVCLSVHIGGISGGRWYRGVCVCLGVCLGSMSAWEGVCPGGSLPGGCLPRGVCLPGGVFPGGEGCLPRRCLGWHPPADAPTRWPLPQLLCILLECILVLLFCYLLNGPLNGLIRLKPILSVF